MTDKLVRSVTAEGVCLEFVRESDRGGRVVVASVQMSPDQAHSVGADLVQAAKEFPGPVDPASTGGA